ncbi:MAG TPA: asparagine synthase (glutamine-hydrolyzing) [bacterium]|nr:asparagine synthase (glutamine-hydrolyzing) [bacterium]
MCGICGFVTTGAATGQEPVDLQRMTDAMVHRGPDDQGHHLQGHAALGARRLSIIDLEGGHQPLSNEDGTTWVAFNGEIFNYRELRAELVSRGHRLATASDTEVIVHLYEEYGADCAERLRGMFAFAIWDDRRETLVLARDRLGIKPLYYGNEGGRFAFASELTSLRRALPHSPELDARALDEYVTLGYVPCPRTILAGFHKLPPAHVLVWARGQTRVRRYWTVRYDTGERYSEADATDRLRAHLDDAVRAWMISDVPVGAFLSGGLDSSTVTGLMRGVTGERVKTFSIGFDDPAYNELGYARQAADRYGTEHHEVVLGDDEMTRLPQLAWFLDEPMADDSTVPMFAVSRLAAEHVKVVLSGDGGDELFGGYGWTTRDQFRRASRWLPAPVRRTLARVAADRHPVPAGGWSGRVRSGLRDIAGTMEDGYLRRTTVGEPFRASLYHPAFRAQLNGHDGTAVLRELLAAAAVKDARERMLHADQSLYLPDDILFKVDRMSMAHSLEARTPLLDHHLVEFVATLPYELKVRGLTSKYLLKRAVRDLVPAPLLRQRKQGFSMPVGRWLRGRTGAHVRGVLLGPAAQRRRLWSPEFVGWLLDEHQAGRRDFGRRLWSLLVLEVWARLHLDGGTRETAPASLGDLA